MVVAVGGVVGAGSAEATAGAAGGGVGDSGAPRLVWPRIHDGARDVAQWENLGAPKHRRAVSGTNVEWPQPC